MKFSKHTTYGLRAMARLAKSSDEEFVSLTKISKQEKISKKYLEQIFSKLRTAKLVEAGKGKKGGYKLLSKPEKISLAEIVQALEGKISPSSCLSGDGHPICSEKKGCGILSVLAEIQKNVKKILQETSLRDIERRHK